MDLLSNELIVMGELLVGNVIMNFNLHATSNLCMFELVCIFVATVNK